MSGTVMAIAAVSPSAVSATISQLRSNVSCNSWANMARSRFENGEKPQFSLHAAL